MKKALVIGIDDYPVNPLAGCVNDALAVATMLERNGDGSPNFAVKSLTSNNGEVSNAILADAVTELFKGEADTALMFFAGHGLLNQDTNSGFLVGQDGKKGSWGVALTDIIKQANDSNPKIKSSVIILDSCHSGFAGEAQMLGKEGLSVIGNGVTILTACSRSEFANEFDGHGLFTGLLLDALAGSSADICGRVTPASIYSHIDQTLGPWDQRPVYKANVQSFVVLRQINSKVALETLRNLPKYFPDPAAVFPLDPSFEPDRQNVPEKFRNLPRNEENERIFAELQACNRQGLVAPIDAPHMYYAAINSTACKLTALGAHYRKLAELDRI